MSERFICLEDEIDLRRAVRAIYRHEGWAGIFKGMGELTQQLQILTEVAQEINAEEKKKAGL